MGAGKSIIQSKAPIIESKETRPLDVIEEEKTIIVSRMKSDREPNATSEVKEVKVVPPSPRVSEDEGCKKGGINIKRWFGKKEPKQEASANAKASNGELLKEGVNQRTKLLGETDTMSEDLRHHSASFFQKSRLIADHSGTGTGTAACSTESSALLSNGKKKKKLKDNLEKVVDARRFVVPNITLSSQNLHSQSQPPPPPPTPPPPLSLKDTSSKTGRIEIKNKFGTSRVSHQEISNVPQRTGSFRKTNSVDSQAGIGTGTGIGTGKSPSSHVDIQKAPRQNDSDHVETENNSKPRWPWKKKKEH